MTLPNLKDLKFLEQIQVQRCLNIFESNLNVKKNRIQIRIQTKSADNKPQ